uniref:WLM domain-containing protein n=1 Tax=viral metagenome TaxID=1070528 RepID=A0A6C0BSA9_9ZZZZ
MSNINILGYVLIVVILLLSLKIYLDSDTFNLRCIISEVDGNKYCVRERSKITMAADLLAKVTQKLKELVEYVGKKYPERENVQRLVKNFNPTKIQETLPTSKLTAYSENKGEKIAFCLTTQKKNNDLIDIETLTFVGIHELAHLASITVGHQREFWDNFKFLLEEAKESNVYNPVDYKKNPKEYCGMKISDSPYYDL